SWVGLEQEGLGKDASVHESTGQCDLETEQPSRGRVTRQESNDDRHRPGGIGSNLAGILSQSGPELPVEGQLPALDGATAWLNSEALTTAGLLGKVVLVNICTYTCINWLRSCPHVRGWADRYKQEGLVVIGVHSPEFEFEHDLENVRR